MVSVKGYMCVVRFYRVIHVIRVRSRFCVYIVSIDYII